MSVFGLTTLGTVTLCAGVYIVWWALTRTLYAVFIGVIEERVLSSEDDSVPVCPIVGEVTFIFLFALLTFVFLPLEILKSVNKKSIEYKKNYTLKTKEVRKEEGQLSIPPAEEGALSVHNDHYGFTGQPL